MVPSILYNVHCTGLKSARPRKLEDLYFLLSFSKKYYICIQEINLVLGYEYIVHVCTCTCMYMYMYETTVNLVNTCHACSLKIKIKLSARIQYFIIFIVHCKKPKMKLKGFVQKYDVNILVYFQ